MQIYYFTGTGNSLFAAKQMAGHFPDTELFSINKNSLNSVPVCTSETVGFVFPNYYGLMPGIVYDFVKKADLSAASYIFCIITAGGMAGGTVLQLNKLLQEKGKKVNASHFQSMPGNYILASYYKFTNGNEKKRQRLYEKAVIKIKSFAAVVKNKKNTSHKGGRFSGFMLRKMSAYAFKENLSKWDKFFTVTDQCNRCGICERMCPKQNIISNSEKKPVWQQDCQLCLRCIHWCPQAAIEFEKGKKFSTKGKPRYHQPDIKASELYI